MAHRLLGVLAAATTWGALCSGCVPAEGEEAEAPSEQTASRAPLVFDYVTRDGNHVTGQSTRGRVTVVFFLTTYDLPSQVVARELSELMRRKKPRFNVLGVVLEPPKNAPLVDAFSSTMELPFPLALTPRPGVFDEGRFGKVDAVPTVVVLDRSGVQRFRKAGAMSTEALESAITDAER